MQRPTHLKKEVNIDGVSITASFGDEGWYQHASSEDGNLHSNKVIAMRFFSTDGSELSSDLKSKIILLMGNECRELEEEIYTEQSEELKKSGAKIKIYKRSSQIPDTTLNTINKDSVFARCHVDFESK